MQIERIDQRLARAPKPGIEPVNADELGPEDVLIFCAGFEERSIEFCKRVLASAEFPPNIIIIDYLPPMDENKHLEIMGILDSARIEAQTINYDRHDPAAIGNGLITTLREYGGNIYLDISGMSRLLIVQAIVSIGSIPDMLSRLIVVYSEAKEYPPNREDVEKYMREAHKDVDDVYSSIFLSKGIYEVTVVPELASISMLGQPIRIITFPSFEDHRIKAVRGEVQPSYWTFIHGIPPRKENMWRPDAIKALNRIDAISNREEVSASTINYVETLDRILHTYAEKNIFEKIIIVPTGSKMQTVGVAIFRIFMKDVQIAYPTPITFPEPERYTIGTRNIYKIGFQQYSKLAREYGLS